jgi:hypothetical protein
MVCLRCQIHQAKVDGHWPGGSSWQTGHFASAIWKFLLGFALNGARARHCLPAFWASVDLLQDAAESRVYRFRLLQSPGIINFLCMVVHFHRAFGTDHGFRFLISIRSDL